MADLEEFEQRNPNYEIFQNSEDYQMSQNLENELEPVSRINETIEACILEQNIINQEPPSPPAATLAPLNGISVLPRVE